MLSEAYRELEGQVPPNGFLQAIALKKSLRSDRLYQPLYEANVMQLLLEVALGAPRLDFVVHVLTSEGTAASKTYKAASLVRLARDDRVAHRAVSELYQATTPADTARRFLSFLDARLSQLPHPR